MFWTCIVMADAKLYRGVKNRWILYLQKGNVMKCKLYLNSAVKNVLLSNLNKYEDNTDKCNNRKAWRLHSTVALTNLNGLRLISLNIYIIPFMHLLWLTNEGTFRRGACTWTSGMNFRKLRNTSEILWKMWICIHLYLYTYIFTCMYIIYEFFCRKVHSIM